MTVLDVGSNVGFYTIQMSRLVGRSGAVFAFEADSLIVDYLERNLALNNCDNVTVVKAAVADRNGPVRFMPDGGDRGYVDWKGTRGNWKVVNAISLDSYFEGLNWPAVDMIKLDIEGGELAALAGMTRVCERNPSMSIVMELNRETIRRAGTTEHRLLTELKRLGYSHGYVIERDLQPFDLNGSLMTGGAMYNLLVAHQAPSRARS